MAATSATRGSQPVRPPRTPEDHKVAELQSRIHRRGVPACDLLPPTHQDGSGGDRMRVLNQSDLLRSAPAEQPQVEDDDGPWWRPCGVHNSWAYAARRRELGAVTL